MVFPPWVEGRVEASQEETDYQSKDRGSGRYSLVIEHLPSILETLVPSPAFACVTLAKFIKSLNLLN
jgi:hypothetical protein